MEEEDNEDKKKDVEERVARLEKMLYQMVLKEDIENANNKFDGIIDRKYDWPDID